MQSNKKFRFIDLFAGIGGFRIALEEAGGECVFSSEYDRHAQETYCAFFGLKPIFDNIKRVEPAGDITQIDPSQVPDHEILAAGFPCQPFSLAGVSKKQSLGRPHGFKDPTQGTLFFNLKEIIHQKRPEAFLLENVKNIKSHDGGKTIRVIMDSLDEIGYEVAVEVLDAASWTPQHRERAYFIGFRRPDPKMAQKWKIRSEDFDFSALVPSKRAYELDDVLQSAVHPKLSDVSALGTY